ncbi:acyltransferase family protein [Flexibacterium corallicola]|uniref:acyltransferase family protein n=1 Tax=Flexibacterium corallicola TaxID=3037259 RepID=UPI00286F417A|nr:acyltransferase family protein [Pseudovibrio sp. M1P-2-3]
MGHSTATKADRVDWVDYAKGICIIFVVMMHSTLGVEAALGSTGWMGDLVAFAKPFRMPAFFMISGLFIVRTVQQNWVTYLDRKLLHFAYFYILWLSIQFVLKLPSFTGEYGWSEVLKLYLLSFIEPFGTLWFIYILPLFFISIKLLHDSKVPALIAICSTIGMQVANVDSGWLVLDNFTQYFIYFYIGFSFSPLIFKVASRVKEQKSLASLFLVFWAFLNGYLVFYGEDTHPAVSLCLGGLGAIAVVCVSALITKARGFAFIRGCGRNSLVIYLSFFFPMAVSRMVLPAIFPSIDVLSALVTFSAVCGPLLLWWCIQKYGLGKFLFARPGWAHMRGRGNLQENYEAS